MNEARHGCGECKSPFDMYGIRNPVLIITHSKVNDIKYFHPLGFKRKWDDESMCGILKCNAHGDIGLSDSN